MYSFRPSADSPKLKRFRQGTSEVRASLLVARSIPRNSQRRLPPLPFDDTVYPIFLSGVMCRPATVLGAGPIGVNSNLRLFRSKRANPKTRLCTIGSE